MTMRMTGIVSGMDTESIIKELVAVKRTKVDDAKKSQTKLDWKTEAWKGLNTKLRNLQSKYVSTMRFTSAYSKLTTSVSDSSKVDVITGENAVSSVQSLKIRQLAKTAYLTGDVVEPKGEVTKYTALSTMKELYGGDIFAAPAVDPDDPDAETPVSKLEFKLTQGVGTNVTSTTFEFTQDDTVSSFLGKLRDAGLNANFDEKTQRFFISAKESGEKGNFTLEAVGENATKGNELLTDMGLKTNSTWVPGQDAIIELNDAEFTNSSNVFEINGLTITALNETAGEDKITLTTKQDTDGIYDMIKNFLKEYNAVINEMDKLYNAESAKGFEPLTDDEKDEMSDSEIEKWEQKIKDSILRRDDTLYSVSDALKSIMSKGVEMSDGTTLYLSEFGIGSLGYFESAENEKNALHIDGDPDDSSTSGNADKLKSAIANDPDKVVNFFSKLFNNLYNKMNDLSSSVEDTRSFGNFYNDKKMKKDYDEYKTKIKDLEKALADYEDKWYAKFSAMETALSKLQSKTDALTNMLG